MKKHYLRSPARPRPCPTGFARLKEGGDGNKNKRSPKENYFDHSEYIKRISCLERID